MIYFARDHYWIVAASTDQVFSSARAAYVPTSDETYEEWAARGNQPTSIGSETELWDVLFDAGFSEGIPTDDQAAQSHLRGRQIASLGPVAMAILLDHENRLLALEAAAPSSPQSSSVEGPVTLQGGLTPEEFIDAIKALPTSQG